MADQSQVKKIVVAVALLAIAGVLLVTRGGGGSKISNQAWYYDVETHQLFAADPGQLPPIAAPSGAGNGVAAQVFTCSSCDEAGRVVVYLESMTERGRALMEDPDLPRQPGEELDAALIAMPPAEGDPIQWVSATSQQAGVIQGRIANLCQGAGAKPCTP